MKIELKNIKHAAFNSEETQCFTASVYINGVRSGTVRNGGHGGSDHFEPRALQETLEAYARTLPMLDVAKLVDSVRPAMVPQSAEGLIADCLEHWLQVKDNQRACKGKTVYKLAGQTYRAGEFHVLKLIFSPAVKAELVSKHGPDIWFLNEHING